MKNQTTISYKYIWWTSRFNYYKNNEEIDWTIVHYLCTLFIIHRTSWLALIHYTYVHYSLYMHVRSGGSNLVCLVKGTIISQDANVSNFLHRFIPLLPIWSCHRGKQSLWHMWTYGPATEETILKCQKF